MAGFNPATQFSDREIGGVAAAAIDADGACPLAQILDGDRVQPRHHFILQRLYQRRNDAYAEFRTRIDGLAFLVLEAFGDAHHIADRDAAELLRQAIAAARSAHAFEHARAHQLLHDLLEIALRHALP